MRLFASITSHLRTILTLFRSQFSLYGPEVVGLGSSGPTVNGVRVMACPRQVDAGFGERGRMSRDGEGEYTLSLLDVYALFDLFRRGSMSICGSACPGVEK